MDEAYQPFASRDSLARLKRHEHVLLMRTMSKFGLAGVRIGYLIGRQKLIAELDKLRPPFNVSVLNCEAALFALEHVDEYAKQAATIRAERAKLSTALAVLPGVTPFPSEANMILVRVPDAKRVFEGMKARRAGEERVRPAPLAGQLPAHHHRHAGRKPLDPGRLARRP
jgi:histidinol-phosphate aminotransferase